MGRDMPIAIIDGAVHHENTKAYDEGYAAFQIGSPITAHDTCHYTYAGSYDCWRRGWMDAMAGKPHVMERALKQNGRLLWIWTIAVVGVVILLFVRALSL